MKAETFFTLAAVCTAISLHAEQSVSSTAASQQIDVLLAQSWQKHKITPNPLVDDATFLRRAYLTVVGRIPSYDEAKAFHACQAPDKRAKLIDSLLASPGYEQNFFNYWADVLRAQSQGVAGSTTAQSYLNYIRESLRTNKPWDQMAHELVTSAGSCFDTGAIGYYMRDRGMPLDNLSNTTRVFLGTRMECAQCHDHPFDQWTQKQFYQMAAFTHNMTATSYRSKGGDEAAKLIRQDKTLDKETQDLMRQALTEVFRPLRDTQVVENKNQIRLPHDYKYKDAKPKEVVPASVMFGKPVNLSKDKDPIQEFGRWMTSPENPRFTTIIANRLWKRVFGVGIYEQVDEMTELSVASNPELMHFLEKQMVAFGYDMKAYLRMLLNTQAFARASEKEAPPGVPYYFQGPVFHRMTAEQVWDSLVTLVSPDPEQSNWSMRERERRDLEHRRRLAAMLDQTEASLLIDAAKMVAEVMREQNREFDKLRKELDVARAKDDKEKARDIQRRLGESQRILRQNVSKYFYEAASKSGNKAVRDGLVASAGGGPMEMAMMNMLEDSRVDPQDAPLDSQLLKRIKADEAILGIKDAKGRESYERYQRTLHQSWCRAAELPSPAPRGHFLREFGQSDRDVVENSSDEASVPQALTIMNGSQVSQITGGWSVLNVNLRKATTNAEKIDTFFLSLYAHLPSAQEKAHMLQILESYAANKSLWEDLTRAALSTQSFIFIQ